jgi:hypothetical protein
MHVLPGLDATALWIRGAEIGLFVAGVDTLVGMLTPDLTPSWPKFDAENAVFPWLARAAATAGIVTPMAAAIVAFRWLDRLTSGWTRHRVLCVVLLMLVEGAIAAIQADQWLDIVVTGVIGGMVSALLFAFVVRFDLRVVPALIASHATVAIVADAMQKSTAQAWMLAAVGATLTLAISWVATRYLVAQGEIPHVAVQPAPAPGAG